MNSYAVCSEYGFIDVIYLRLNRYQNVIVSYFLLFWFDMVMIKKHSDK